MFNVGGGEVLMILLLALIVLGPQKLPDAARRVGNVMGELRRMSSGFQAELRAAMDEPDQPGPRRLPTASTPATPETAPAPANGHATRPRRREPLRAATRPKRPRSS